KSSVNSRWNSLARIFWRRWRWLPLIARLTMPDKITIDTNVFVHLFNPANNVDDHIDQLLQGLVGQQRMPCYDTTKTNRINSEYTHQLAPIIRARTSEK